MDAQVVRFRAQGPVGPKAGLVRVGVAEEAVALLLDERAQAAQASTWC